MPDDYLYGPHKGFGGDQSRADASRGYQDPAQQRAADNAATRDALRVFSNRVIAQHKDRPKLPPPTPQAHVEHSETIFQPRSFSLLNQPQKNSQMGQGTSLPLSEFPNIGWSVVTKAKTWGIYNHSRLRNKGATGDFVSVSGLAALDLSSGMHSFTAPACIYLKLVLNDPSDWESSGYVDTASIEVNTDTDVPSPGMFQMSYNTTTNIGTPTVTLLPLGYAYDDAGKTNIVAVNPGGELILAVASKESLDSSGHVQTIETVVACAFS